MREEEARRLLGVSASASASEVDQAFRRLARVWHPDRGGDAGTFQRLVSARALLTGTGRPGTRGGAGGERSARGQTVLVVRRSAARRVLHALRSRLPAAPPRVR